MIISPLLGLVMALRRSSDYTKRWVITIFTTFYGSIIMLSPSNDGYRHWQRVYDYYLDVDFASFLTALWNILMFEPQYWTNDDVYQHVLSYFTGTVLGLPELFFVFVSFVYGYFFSGVLVKVLSIKSLTSRKNLSYLFLFFAGMFVMWKNIEGINTVRTWTGLWILLYAALNYFESGKRKYLFLMAVPPFIHVAYFLMALPAWIVAIFGTKWKVVYASLFVLSFLTSVSQTEVFDYFAQVPLGEAKFQAYLIEDETRTFEQRMGEGTWYRQLQIMGLHFWGLQIITGVLLITFLWSKNTMNRIEEHLYSVAILTFSLANFFFFLGALYNRASLIAGLFLLAVLVLLLKRNALFNPKVPYNNLNRIGLWIGALMLVPFFIYQTADIIYYVSFFLIAFPFFPWLLPDENISIREFVGMVLDLIR